MKLINEQMNKELMDLNKQNEELKSMNDMMKKDIEETKKNNFDLYIVINNLKKR